jgi:hypothetical protein
VVSLSDVPKSVFSYDMKWSYFIAEYASCRYNIRLSCRYITLRLLTQVSKRNLGKEKTADHCAKLSVAMTGKKHKISDETHVSKHTGPVYQNDSMSSKWEVSSSSQRMTACP